MTDTLISDGPPTYGRAPRVLLRDPNISPQAKALWTLIEDFASPDSPQPFPGQTLLGEYMGVTYRSVRTWIAELKSAGWLEVTTQTTPTGKRNQYRLMWTQGVRKLTSPPMRKEASGGVGKQASHEEEPVEEEPSEVKTSSQSDLQRERADRQRDERNRNVDPRQKTSDWNKVLNCAKAGQHRWSEHLHLSPIARAAASEVAVTIKMGTVSDGRVAFYAAWDALYAEGLTGVRESVA